MNPQVADRLITAALHSHRPPATGELIFLFLRNTEETE